MPVELAKPREESCLQLVLQKILHLFAHTQLTLKEVAFAVGMKNVTHLNSLLKAHYGKTPSQLCREYRFTGLSGHTD